MPRARTGVAHLRRRNKVLKRAKGFVAGRSKLYRIARQAVSRADQFAFRGRKEKKRQFRQLWITRISGALWLKDMNYSQFMYGLRLAEIQLNRKMLSEIAINDPSAFDALIVKAQEAIKAQKAKVAQA